MWVNKYGKMLTEQKLKEASDLSTLRERRLYIQGKIKMKAEIQMKSKGDRKKIADQKRKAKCRQRIFEKEKVK